MTLQEQPRDAIGRYGETIKDGLYEEIVEDVPATEAPVTAGSVNDDLADALDEYEAVLGGDSGDAEFTASWSLGESLRERLEAPDGASLPGAAAAWEAVAEWERVREGEEGDESDEYNAAAALADAARGLHAVPSAGAEASLRERLAQTDFNPDEMNDLDLNTPGAVLQFVHDTRAGRSDSTWLVVRAADGGLEVRDLGEQAPVARLGAVDLSDPVAVQSAVMSALSPAGSFDNPTWHPLPTVEIDPDSMYSSVQGAKFTGWRPAAAIAKDVRADVKDAVAGGYLPGDLDYSVTTDTYSGGQSVNVVAKGLPLEEAVSRRFDGFGDDLVPSAYAREVAGRLRALTDQFNDQSHHGEIDYFRSTFSGVPSVLDEAETAGRDLVRVEDRFKAAYRKAKRGGANEEALAALTSKWRAEHQTLREQRDHLYAVKDAARAQIQAGAEDIDWARARAAVAAQGSASAA